MAALVLSSCNSLFSLCIFLCIYVSVFPSLFVPHAPMLLFSRLIFPCCRLMFLRFLVLVHLCYSYVLWSYVPALCSYVPTLCSHVPLLPGYAPCSFSPHLWFQVPPSRAHILITLFSVEEDSWTVKSLAGSLAERYFGRDFRQFTRRTVRTVSQEFRQETKKQLKVATATSLRSFSVILRGWPVVPSCAARWKLYRVALRRPTKILLSDWSWVFRKIWNALVLRVFHW